jgi:hypothetical protein
MQPREIHVLWRLRRMEPAQDQLNAFGLRCLYPSTRAADEKSSEATMLEPSNHLSSVTQGVNGLQRASRWPPNVGVQPPPKAVGWNDGLGGDGRMSAFISTNTGIDPL